MLFIKDITMQLYRVKVLQDDNKSLNITLSKPRVIVTRKNSLEKYWGGGGSRLSRAISNTDLRRFSKL